MILPFTADEDLNPQLTYGEVHVWGGYLDCNKSEIRNFDKLLSSAEKRKAQRFNFEKDRQRFIFSHAILREILGAYLESDPESLKFCQGKHGKPRLATASGRKNIHFNMSYSHEFVLFGFARHAELGVDIEYRRDITEMDQIIRRFFSVNECRQFQSLPLPKRKEAFYNCWTRKEAFIKATGQGLSQTLNSFDVSLVPGEPARLIRTMDDPHASSRWTLKELTPAPGYTAAIAVRGPVRRLKTWMGLTSHQKNVTADLLKMSFASRNLQPIDFQHPSCN